MSKKKIKVSQIIEAMEADNVPLQRGGWFKAGGPNTDSKIGAACFMGIAAINLGVHSSSLQIELDRVSPGLSSDIIRWNDSQYKSYESMLKDVKSRLKSHQDEEVLMESAFYYHDIGKS